MASAVSHVVAALGIGTCFHRPGTPRRLWPIAALCSIIPDLDVMGFRFGIRYGDFWGHRGFTHSLLFAALLACAAMNLSFLRELPWQRRFLVWTYFFSVTASHGLLDAMTDGGLGVAFFAPFDNRRYFLPWRPIVVSPLSPARFFFTNRGIAVLRSELVWIWLPAMLLGVSAWIIRRSNSVEADSG